MAKKDDDLKETMIATPIPGWPLQWTQDPTADKVQWNKADCLEVDETSPGRITVRIHIPNRPYFDRTGVLWCEMDEWKAEQPGDKSLGAWRYLPGIENTDKFAVHHALRERQRKQAEIAAQRRMEERKRIEERRAAAERAENQRQLANA